MICTQLFNSASEHSSKLGPYLGNGLTTHLVDYWSGQRDCLPVMFELKPTDLAVAWQTLTEWFAASKDCRLTVAHDGSAYGTADCTQVMLAKLLESELIHYVELADTLKSNRATYGPSIQKSVLNTERIPRISSEETPDQTILGVIDHGCPFAHQVFRKNNGASRVFALWDQDEDISAPHDYGSTPERFGYGRQLNSDNIKGIMADANVGGSIDEALCYKLGGQPLKTRATHGAHVLGLLASSHDTVHEDTLYPESVGKAAKAPIAFVQLPRAFLETPFSKTMERCVYDGLRYLMLCGVASNASRVVAVVDYGTHLGSHDGTGWLETALDAMISEASNKHNLRLDIFFPSGNAFEKRIHARIDQIVPKRTSLHWVIPPANDAPSFLEIWYKLTEKEEKEKNLNPLVFKNPAGKVVCKLELSGNQFPVTWPSENDAVCVATQKQFGAQAMVLIQIAPTSVSAERSCADAGRWTLEFDSESRLDISLDVFVSSGGTNIGFAQRVWPTHLMKTPASGDNCKITGIGTAISTACGENTWMVSGYEAWLPYQLASYACSGPVRGGKRSKDFPEITEDENDLPKKICGADLAGVTEQGFTRPGVRQIGTRSGSYIRLIGTSMAAPQVARKVIDTDGILASISIGSQSKAPRKGTKERQEAFERRV
jgi:hypothetical protein